MTQEIFIYLSQTLVRVSDQKHQALLNQARNLLQLRKSRSIFMSNRNSHHIKLLVETKEELLGIILMILMMNFEEKTNTSIHSITIKIN